MSGQNIHQLVEFELAPTWMAKWPLPGIGWQVSEVFKKFLTPRGHASKYHVKRCWWLRGACPAWRFFPDISYKRIISILYNLYLLQGQPIGNIEMMRQLKWRPLALARFPGYLVVTECGQLTNEFYASGYHLAPHLIKRVLQCSHESLQQLVFVFHQSG